MARGKGVSFVASHDPLPARVPHAPGTVWYLGFSSMTHIATFATEAEAEAALATGAIQSFDVWNVGTAYASPHLCVVPDN